MKKKYNGKKSIGVLELSSTAIKALVGEPKVFVRKPYELGRFRSKTFPFFLIDYIDDSAKLDLVGYSKVAIPKIVKTVKWIFGMAPQAFKIILTGHYRNIINGKEFLELLNDAIGIAQKYQIHAPEVLTPQRESQLSFQSWLHTTLPIPEKEPTTDMFFFLNTGLNLDVGGGTSEVTLIENMSFDNTISLPYGADMLRVEIINLTFVDFRHFRDFTQDLEDNIQNGIKRLLKKRFPNPLNVEYCICSGSNVIVEGGDEYNNRRKADIGSLNWELSEYKSILDQVIFPYIENKKEIPNKHLKYLMRYCAFVIFKAIANHFRIDSYYLNYANLRIGVFYELIDELKDRSAD